MQSARERNYWRETTTVTVGVVQRTGITNWGLALRRGGEVGCAGQFPCAADISKEAAVRIETDGKAPKGCDQENGARPTRRGRHAGYTG